jgi:hypothetical protein
VCKTSEFPNILIRVGIKKPAQKKPKKTRLKKNQKTHPQVVFLGFFERSLCFVNKFAVFPLKGL